MSGGGGCFGGAWRLQLPGPVAVLLLGFFVMNLGYFMAIPLLALHATGSLGLPAWQAGLVVGTLTVCHRGLGLPGGVLADRIDRRRLLMIGLAMRAAGFTLFGLASGLDGLLVASVVAGTGAALVAPLVPAALATLVEPAIRPRVFAARSASTNVAAALGPLLATALLQIDIRATFLAAALLHVGLLAGVISTRGLATRSDGAKVPGIRQHLAHDQVFLRFCLVLVGFWILQTQLYVGVPLRAAELKGPGTEAATLVSMLFLISGGIVIVSQVAVPKVIRWLGASRAFGGGLAACAVAMVLLGTLPGVPGLVIAVAWFSLGMAVALPALDVSVSDMAPDGLVGSYFGIASLAWAVGGFTGSAGGGWLFGTYGGGIVTWGLLGAIGLLAAAAAGRSRVPSLAEEGEAKR